MIKVGRMPKSRPYHCLLVTSRPTRQTFEAELVRRGTPFFFGDRPGMLDLMIWPWVERFPAARKLGVTSLPQGEMPPPPPEIKHFVSHAATVLASD